MSFYLTGKYWMPGGTTIREAIFAGIEAANVKYGELSDGWWVTDTGVEGLLVSAIAERLDSKQRDGESLVMELPFRYIMAQLAKRRHSLAIAASRHALGDG